MSLEDDAHGVFAMLKHAAEQFELRMLNADAQVRPSVLDALSPQIGTWSGTMSTWLMPGEPYDVQSVTSTAQWIVGGKFLERRFEGLFMGQPFEAVMLTGYDDSAGHYVAAWVDSATTAMLALQGSHDEATQTLTLEGSMKLVRLIGSGVNVRSQLVLRDPDTLRIEISIGRFGIYFKAHQIDLARVTPP